MSDNYPLFPDLPEPAAVEAVALIERFKAELRKVAENAIGDLYVDVLPHIESDAWTNFRNALMDGFRNYGNRKIQGEYDFREIRQAILREHRAEIIADLDQDNLARIATLEKEVEMLRDDIRRRI